MKLIIDTDYCPVRNFDDVCSLCNCECISGEALTRDCPLIRNGGTPYNPTGDLISRYDAVIALNEAQIEGTPEYRGLGKAKQIIDDLQAVEPERPQGDCISREALRKLVVDVRSWHTPICSGGTEYGEGAIGMADEIIELIDNAPPVELFTQLEKEEIADAINYLLGAELLEENGYTEEVKSALKSALKKVGVEENES